MRTLILSTALLAGLGSLAAMNAQAADGTISFNGTIRATTCAISAGAPTGGKDYTVQLPTVHPSAFTATGVVVGTTPYSIFVGKGTGSDCPNGTKARVRYEPSSPMVDASTGNLKLVAGPSSATGVQIQILNGDKSHINLATRPESSTYTVSENKAELKFYGQYVSTASSVTAGTANSSVLYTMMYD